nr:GntR family transcriptional regulator [Lysinibacillus timonensis]
MMFETIQHETLPQKIARIIRDAIIQGRFKPGERLIQDELAKSLGVSRMPIREAFKQLQAEGYVMLEPHKGAVVKEFSIQEIEEIYFLRSKLEPLAVRESLKSINDMTIQQMEVYQEIMKKTKSIHEYVDINIKFHSLFIKDCKLEKLNSIIQSLWTGFPQQTPHLLPNQIKLSLQEHDEMLQAVKQGKMDEACAVLEQHIVRAGKNVLENLKKKQ